MLNKKVFLNLLKNRNYIEENGIFKYKIVGNKEEKINRKCYDKIAPKFKAFWESLEDWQLNERKKFVSYLHNNPIILDFGCGQGRDLEIFSKLGINKLVGIDFSISQLELAKQRKVARLVNTNFDNMPFRNKSFDGIWSCVTLLHTEESKMIPRITKIYNLLKKNGIFFISLQKGKRYKTIKRDKYNKVPMIIYYYEPEQIKKMLVQVGFEIIDYEEYHVWKGIAERERKFFNFYCRKI